MTPQGEVRRTSRLPPLRDSADAAGWSALVLLSMQPLQRAGLRGELAVKFGGAPTTGSRVATSITHGEWGQAGAQK